MKVIKAFIIYVICLLVVSIVITGFNSLVGMMFQGGIIGYLFYMFAGNDLESSQVAPRQKQGERKVIM